MLLCRLLVAFLLSAAPAAAHPHVWIEAKSDVVFDERGQIVALNHQWTMDEMYSEAGVDGLDKNGDGIYSPEELAPLTKENIESLKEYDYFTSFRAGAEKSAFGEVVEASQQWSNKRLTLSFRLPLKQPVDPLKTQIVYRVYDPGFFIAIEFPSKDAVSATGTLPQGCRIELQVPVSDQQAADAKAMLATKGVDWQAPPEEDFGAMFAQPIAVACGVVPQAAAVDASDLSSRSLVQPRQAPSLTPPFWADPAAFVLATQQSFYRQISGAISRLRSGPSWTAAWTLMLLSLGYGVFHAAGPGHGKTVISGWVLATGQQLKRGIIVSFASALIQALSAILIVTVLLFLVKTVGSSARSVAAVLETASYGFIALLGFFLLWQAMGMIWPSRPGVAATANLTGTSHRHEASCTHNHIPAPRDLGRNWSLSKALSISFAVGIRPCTGAILALLFANAVGVYWAGVAATFVMAIGTALTVSAIAMIAVFSKTAAMSMLDGRQVWLDWTAFGLRLGGGLLIAFLGATLFWGSLNGAATAG